MKRHTITEKELDAWLDENVWRQFACSFGTDTAKTFETDNRGVYRVRDHGETIFLGADKAQAINIYNSAS